MPRYVWILAAIALVLVILWMVGHPVHVSTN